MPKPPPALASHISVQAYVRLVKVGESLHGSVSRGLSPYGLTASQFSTLKVLRLRGPLPQRDIATYLLRTGGNVTVVVDNLEKQGLVTRLRDTSDRRMVYVQLTAKGNEIFDEVYEPHLEHIVEVMEGLSPAECETLCTLLDRLLEKPVEAACAEPILPAARSSAS